ncbi:MAG TPA: urate hydroxylase PuuD [Candidatus Acidoferrum sp.]|nr:urate hydroxylase PuuD [Candidatus Acidoferrum sp.]
MNAYVLSWLDLVARWFHFVAGISWIGASFYFVWLDNHLVAPVKREDVEDGVFGELWSVHGGGFYHNQKYLTGPRHEPLTEHLHWFKWEAYTTWLSGIALMALVYWVGARSFLIDPSVMALTPGTAIAISIASLLLGWFIYDGLCRLFERQPRVLALSVAVFLVVTSWALYHIFSGRAAFLHVGAIIGTIMVANVFFVIIPGQRRMLAQIRAGQHVDPRPGQLGKMRSVHNTYLTLPALFLMLSYHYPMTYSGPYGWLVLIAIAMAGVLVRYFFVLTHKARIVWALPAAAAIVIAATAIALAPRGAANAAPVAFAQVQPIFAQRCAVCHAAHPTQPGFAAAPDGVLLDTPGHIAQNATRVDAQAVQSHAMPLGNVTHMTDAERTLVGAWIDQGAKI